MDWDKLAFVHLGLRPQAILVFLLAWAVNIRGETKGKELAFRS